MEMRSAARVPSERSLTSNANLSVGPLGIFSSPYQMPWRTSRSAASDGMARKQIGKTRVKKDEKAMRRVVPLRCGNRGRGIRFTALLRTGVQWDEVLMQERKG